jgi:hypothetical protein
MAIEGLGRLYNVAPIAAGTLISVKDCAGIEFIMTGADTFTLASAATYNGTTTSLAVITDYFTCTSQTGGAKWVAATQAAAATLATSGSGSASFFVDCAALPSAALYVSLSAASAGLVTAIVINLLVQRAPNNLRQLSGSSS